MTVSAPLPIHFLSHLNASLKLGFPLQRAIVITQSLSPLYTRFGTTLTHQLSTGSSPHNSIGTLLNNTPAFQFNSPHIALSDWIDSHLIRYSQRHTLYQHIRPHLLRSLGLCILSGLLLTLLLFFFLPYCLGMLSQYQAGIPSWLWALQRIKGYLLQHGLWLFGCIAVALYSTRSLILTALRPLYTPLVLRYHQQQLLHSFAYLIKAGLPLSDVAHALSAPSHSPLHAQITAFKHTVSEGTHLQHAWQALLNHRVYADILHQSIATQQLARGLEQVSALMHHAYLERLKKWGRAVALLLTLLAACCLLVCFYVSLLPLSLILNEALAL